MDRMTADRPHNGVILEASPLPMPSVEELGEVQPSNRQIHLTLSQKQTAEERALYGTSQILPAPHESWRHPFVLLVDGVLDPGNLGNILRSAYFFGVDAVAICVNTCAPLSSPTLHKAASGATEALNILAIQRPADFVVASSRNGWRIHAAVAPEGDKTELSRPQMISQKMTSPLARGPSILMMGAEGEGLRKNLRSKARSNVIIAGRQRHSIGDIGVDSLNVSAATAVLLADFMTNPGEGWNRWSSARPTKPEPEGTMLSDEKSEKMNLPEEAEKLF
ncbi:hypothetical protein AAFC00_000904 [Neodothiora populina]|uniref:tRNA/rRNA methyltransferase SpoU type domain-containing protein n=1 Tax=Neodothiora populina TaxID=2781224 RepID=A0ABR3PN72_9PEZI